MRRNTAGHAPRVVAMALVFTLALVVTLAMVFAAAGCKPATEPGDGGSEVGTDTGNPGPLWPVGSFVAGQLFNYRVQVTIDDKTGTGFLSLNPKAGEGGVLTVAYMGKGPGIAGAPIWDGHEFSGTATVTDPTDSCQAIVDSLDGSSQTIVAPFFQPWKDLFAGQTSWDIGTTWQTADGATASLTGKGVYADIEGVAGEIPDKSISFCVVDGFPVPLYVKVVMNGVTVEYLLTPEDYYDVCET